jgi:ribosome-binding protein aMBF1 (putative translation factor)
MAAKKNDEKKKKTRGIAADRISDPKTFGERLRYAREKKELSQGQLARMVKMSQPSIFFLETRDGGSRHMVPLAHALGVNQLWLATGEGSMYKQITAATLGKIAALILAFAKGDRTGPQGAREVAEEIADLITNGVNGKPAPVAEQEAA